MKADMFKAIDKHAKEAEAEIKAMPAADQAELMAELKVRGSTRT